MYLHATSSHHGCWASQTGDQNQWLQVKFGQRVEIRRVATQGRYNYDQWVTSYKLNYSSDSIVFEHYHTNKDETVFTGNSDRGTVVSHVLNPPIVAQYVRVLPLTWTNHISMRLDFYGCIPDPPVPAAVYPLNGQFGTRDLSSNENPPGVPYNVQLAPGPFGQPNGSYQLSGSSNSYIEFPNNGGLDTRYSLTLLAWVFPENIDGPIFNYGTNYFGVHFWIVNNRLFARLSKRSGGYADLPALTSALKQNSWNFIGTSYDYDSGVQKLWIEGKVYDVRNIGTFEVSTQGDVRMGMRDGDNRFLKGRISCVQVYDKALTEREVHAVRGLCFQKVPLSPVAFFPLNGQYETTDISHSANPPGQASGVELAPGPDGSVGGSYQFSGNLTSFIKFPNNGGLDTRHSMTFLAWIYHEQTKGPIFYYADPQAYGARFILNDAGRFLAHVRSSNFTGMKSSSTVILEPKTWHFVGSSYDYISGKFILWLNGSFHKKKFVSWPDELATQQSVIMGALPGDAGTYKGRISCVQLYDRVLTELEIEDAKQSCITAGRSISNQTIHVREAVEMRCDALEGKTVRWIKDGAVLQTKTAGHGTSLHISSAQQSDEGIYTCEVINSAGQIQASYDVTLRVEDPNSLCTTFKGVYKSDSVWKRWSVLPLNYRRAFYEGKWFRADKGSAMPSSCVLQESCGVQAPGWLNGPIPSGETGIVHRHVCFNFRKDCCYYSLPVQIKKCSDFFVYKLKEVHPNIPGQYCFTTNTPEFVNQVNNVIYTSLKVNHTLTGHVIASETSVGSSLQCMQYCANLANGQCKSFNYEELTGTCQLNSDTGKKENDDMKIIEGYNHYYIPKSDMISLP
ncbi:hypothetical protein ACROYT_G004810 [Oculina patagonica]